MTFEGTDDPVDSVTFAACTDDTVAFTMDPAIEDISARLILFEPYGGLRQQGVTDSEGKIIFDMSNEKEGIYLLDVQRSGYVKPGDIYFKFIHCSNGKLGNTKDKEDALFALLKAKDALRTAQQENKETLQAERTLYDAQKEFDRGHYQKAIALAREAEKLALFGTPKEIIIIEKEVVVENDTIIVVDKEEPAAKEPTPGQPVTPPSKPRQKIGSYTVNTELYTDATVILITFTPEKEFEGTLRSKLDTDYTYYLDGIIDINSPTHGRPSEVAKGSILAYWHNIQLSAQEKFIAEFTVTTELSSEEILSASMHFVEKKDLPKSTSTKTTQGDAAPSPPAVHAGNGQFVLYGIIVLLIIVVLALGFVVLKRKH